MAYFPLGKFHLKEHPGQFFPYSRHKTLRSESLDTVLSRLNPQGQLYLPGLPCFDLNLESDEEPSPFTICIKALEGQEAINSGNRSAIIQYQGRFVRLKGCGNKEKGFNIESMSFPPDALEVRGCCFQHTAAREQYMTDIINEALLPFGYTTGNTPIGIWKYAEDDVSIDKYCGLFYTSGELRLGTHLLSVIDQILSEFPIDAEEIRSLFPSERVDGGSITETIKFIFSNGPLNERLNDWSANPVYTDNSKLVNLLESDAIKSEKLRNIMLLAWKCGYEAGQIKRILQDRNVSWGFFIDHNPFEPHCNAHPNNFLILPKGSTKLLAPIDFDMAFSVDEFVNTFDDSKELLFENWVNAERISLEQALAGQENMANFSYSSINATSCLRVCFRDIIVIAYREAFDKIQDRFFVEREILEDAIEEITQRSIDIINY